jgi:hypothetical protein
MNQCICADSQNMWEKSLSKRKQQHKQKHSKEKVLLRK